MIIDEINSKIEEMQLEYANWTDTDYDKLWQVLPITVDLVDNKFLIYAVYLIEDDWDYHLHRQMITIFNVELIDYKVNYSAYSHDTDKDSYQYVYAAKGYAEPLDFMKRYDKFELMQLGDSCKSYDCDIRTLTHKILKNLRELDNLGVNYDLLLDDSDLRRFLGQTDCFLNHFKQKKEDGE